MTPSQIQTKDIVACVVGARPNFVKMGPILRGIAATSPNLQTRLIHTGQHYDDAMSDSFFRQLGLPKPDVYLSVGSGRQGEQTAKILDSYERWLLECEQPPAATLVVGDVNSTVGCALASVKLGIPVIHVEAGLRSFDRTMPEEINRVVTDAISELLLVSEPSGRENLLKEGKSNESIRLCGNVMIDVLRSQLDAATALDPLSKMGLTKNQYVVWTMHRPSNVDDPELLHQLCESMIQIAERLPVVFPVHPRTRNRLEAIGLWQTLESSPSILATAPLSYHELLGLTSNAKIIITDSGGLQEEATALEIPCLTLRENTERPITVDEGTSVLVGHDVGLLVTLVDDVIENRFKQGKCPQLWDGSAGRRVGSEVAAFLAARKES
ncbi:UDP-N-acetylglucosamine 2-epimerase [Rhodopirellula maiorica SM1]|uniref:UDP-N-acetylglucosamine 2-epimerase n=1 Tax=Rhodopirellula maiorica SM1 TaxID=1265738 RepID=M5R9M0_9BACT|nr:UDP-N-acetylglucosamine 2-epimerase (non-hydrolyzing) [Rhodopirellula maiorica]EMI16075.1 UDP-N-acetylglucosamine 2-epimerase [Rhodopirellula maiorica SM1]